MRAHYLLILYIAESWDRHLSKEGAQDIALGSYECFLHFSPVAYNQITHMFAQRKKKLAEVLKRD